MTVNSPLQIYLFESPVQPFNKYGISRNPVQDGQVIGCGPGLIEPRALDDDRDAVLLVQALSYAYGSAVAVGVCRGRAALLAMVERVALAESARASLVLLV